MTSLDSSPYTYEAPVSADLFDRAQTITPGGVNSPVRAFRAVGGTPRFMAEGSGPWITDADGRRYVDLVSSWGPMILGHAHPAVVEAVTAAARRGFSLRGPTEGELDLAEEIRDRMPRWSGCGWSTPAPRPCCPPSGWPAGPPAGRWS